LNKGYLFDHWSKHRNTDDNDPPVGGQMVQIGTDKKIKKISDHPFNLCHLSARWRISVQKLSEVVGEQANGDLSKDECNNSFFFFLP
jgi:hypothetical protein